MDADNLAPVPALASEIVSGEFLPPRGDAAAALAARARALRARDSADLDANRVAPSRRGAMRAADDAPPSLQIRGERHHGAGLSA